MNADDFSRLRKQACELFASQPPRDKLKVSLDAVFVAVVTADAANATNSDAGTGTGKQSNPPAWFRDTLDRLRGTGEKVTVSRFLLLAGKFPADRSDSLSVARWLREAGIESRKTGGNLIFHL